MTCAILVAMLFVFVTFRREQRWMKIAMMAERVVYGLGQLREGAGGAGAGLYSACEYGVATSIGKRFRRVAVAAGGKNETSGEEEEVEYWKDMLDGIPAFHEGGPDVVAVLNRMGDGTHLNHSRITHELMIPMAGPDQEGGQPEFDEKVLMRPLKRNHGDSLERVKWRSSLSLDLVRMVRFVAEGLGCRRVLWIEDDAVLPPGWFQVIKDWEGTWASPFQSIGPSGTVGVLFSPGAGGSWAGRLHHVLQYVTHHFDEEPVDWILDRYWREVMGRENPPGGKVVMGHQGKVSTLSEARERPVMLKAGGG
jgi:hypothetical protein